jgi:hypothetical protein
VKSVESVVPLLRLRLAALGSFAAKIFLELHDPPFFPYKPVENRGF